MAKMKWKVNDDRRKVKFECIRGGEIFMFMDVPMVKIDKVDEYDYYKNVLNLENGNLGHLEDDALVTYVEKAQLSIDI